MLRGQTLTGLFTSAVEVKEVATDQTHDPNLNQQYCDIRDGRELAVPATSDVKNPLTMTQNMMAACMNTIPSLLI